MNRIIFAAISCLLIITYSCDNKEPIPQPKIVSFSPVKGGFGTTLTITGAGFLGDINEISVTIGGFDTEITSVSENSLTVLVPALTEGDHAIIVSTLGGSNESGPFTYEYTVYIAGSQINEGGIQVAKYWKNGTAVTLSDGTSTTTTSAIALFGNSIYVIGTEYKASTLIKLWKDGIEQSITASAGSSGFDIFATETDLYIAGYITSGTHTIATYWKNGAPTYLTQGETDARARAIHVSGSDIYIAGFERNTTKSVAKYWKNGTEISLTDGQNNANTMDIFAQGSDVYVCGSEYINSVETAKVWKNGYLTTLGGGVNRSFTTSMGIKAGASHITGFENGKGMYWIDGISNSFPNKDSGGNPISVFLLGNDVFMAGSVSDVNGIRAAYWKNDNVYYLTDGTKSASAFSIIVR